MSITIYIEQKATFSNGFSPIDSRKPEDIQFTVILDKVQQNNLTFEELERANVLDFCWKGNSND